MGTRNESNIHLTHAALLAVLHSLSTCVEFAGNAVLEVKSEAEEVRSIAREMRGNFEPVVVGMRCEVMIRVTSEGHLGAHLLAAVAQALQIPRSQE